MENDGMNTYQIIDEPQGSQLSNTTVNPMWPLFGFMIGGAVFSWLWSVLNSFALNSPSRNKELLIVAAGFATFIAMYLGLGTLFTNGSLKGINIEYIKIAIISIELVFCYKLFLTQQASFGVYEYFNGKVASPAIGLLLAFVVGRKLEAFAISSLLSGVQS